MYGSDPGRDSNPGLTIYTLQYIYPLDHHNDLLQTLQFLEFVNLVRQFFLLSTHLQPFFSVKKTLYSIFEFKFFILFPMMLMLRV